jgi:hypothetical protein
VAQRTQLVYSDNPGAVPSSYIVPPTLDLVLQSVVVRWDGSVAAGAFLPTLAAYSQDGKLVGRFHPGTQLEAGDTGVVTYAPFLRASAAAAAASAADLGGAFNVNLPLATGSNVASSGFSFTFDTTYLGGGYSGCTANGKFLTFLLPIGPYGSTWGLRYAYAIGPDFAKFDIDLAQPPEPNPNRSVGILDGSLKDFDAGLTWFNLVTAEDAYTPVLSKTNVHNGQIAFRVAGVDGTAFSGFSGTDPLSGYRLLQGGAGIYRLRFKSNGQNVASTGFKLQFTAIALWRLDDGGYL